ncbi:MAG: aldehyde dehydrogenase [Methylocystaceae bacterium]|nr:aldehyde dehydrogenase [Methylocystaceae bacterium]
MTKFTPLERREVVACLLAYRKNLIAVTSLGSPTYDVAAAGDHERNFYLWGAMGGAAMVGLGLALAQPTVPIVVFCGDGELLMGMGGLATIGLQQPKNLTIIVLDNEMFGETGKQKSHTGRGTDLQAIAKACSITKTQYLANLSDIDTFAKDLETIEAGPRLALIKIADGETSRVIPSRDGVALKIRLRNALGLNNS